MRESTIRRRLAVLATGLALCALALPTARADDDYGPEPRVVAPSATLFAPAPLLDPAPGTSLRHGIDVEAMWHERDEAGTLAPGATITRGEITYVYTAAQPAHFNPGGGVPVLANWDVWVPQGVDMAKPGAFGFMVHRWDRPGGGAAQSVYGGDLLQWTNVGEGGATDLRWVKYADNAPFTSSALSIRPPAGGVAYRSYGLEPFKQLWGSPAGFGTALAAEYTGKDPELIEHQDLISLVASMTPTDIQKAYDPELATDRPIRGWSRRFVRAASGPCRGSGGSPIPALTAPRSCARLRR